MKKSIFLAAAIFGSIALSAQTFTASCVITMKGIPSGTEDVLEIYQIAEAHADKFDNGWESTKMINDRLPSSVNVYAQTSYGNLSTVALPDIKGLPLSIITNESETNYVFIFSDVDGDIMIDDLEIDSVHAMSAGNYAFTAESGKKTLANRFRIHKPFSGDEGELDICYQYGDLTINNNPYTANIVVKDEDGQVVLDKMARTTPQVIDLSSLTKGKMYQVVIGDKTMMIRAQ